LKGWIQIGIVGAVLQGLRTLQLVTCWEWSQIGSKEQANAKQDAFDGCVDLDIRIIKNVGCIMRAPNLAELADSFLKLEVIISIYFFKFLKLYLLLTHVPLP
jgi:hypothetical protein